MNLKIKRPTLLLDRGKAVDNISRMAARAARSAVRLRPHFKTHQSAVVGDWFRRAGVTAITVSSVAMARYFARHGWTDITIAFPVNWLEIDELNELAATIDLNLLVESAETVHFLQAQLQQPVRIWLKIDVGYGRTGLAWDGDERLAALAALVDGATRLQLRGLLTHAGHAYRPGPAAEKVAIYEQTVARLQAARSRITAVLAKTADPPLLELSLGDTPTCTLADDFSGVDEIRPGNFVFYDYMQFQMGVCAVEDIAVALACPVVARHPARQMAVIYGGAVHLSKEFVVLPDGVKSFGAVCLPATHGWSMPLPGAYVSGLSQEHGQVYLPDGLLADIQIGDLLLVLPVHSCLTANLRQRYLTLAGEWVAMAGVL